MEVRNDIFGKLYPTLLKHEYIHGAAGPEKALGLPFGQ
jgi:hypothetical protein